jgi:hypothetical protein
MITYNEIVSIRRHQQTIDIKHGSLSQPLTLQCQVDRVSFTRRMIDLLHFTCFPLISIDLGTRFRCTCRTIFKFDWPQSNIDNERQQFRS